MPIKAARLSAPATATASAGNGAGAVDFLPEVGMARVSDAAGEVTGVERDWEGKGEGSGKGGRKDGE